MNSSVFFSFPEYFQLLSNYCCNVTIPPKISIPELEEIQSIIPLVAIFLVFIISVSRLTAALKVQEWLYHLMQCSILIDSFHSVFVHNSRSQQVLRPTASHKSSLIWHNITLNKYPFYRKAKVIFWELLIILIFWHFHFGLLL